MIKKAGRKRMFNLVVLDSDLNLKSNKLKKVNTIRTASRGIVFDSFGKIAVFYKENMNEYKLPGGGIDSGETPIEAFKREVLEETGLIVDEVELIGVTNEIKSKTKFFQTSFVFVSKMIVNTGRNHLTDKEIIEGGKFIWLNLNDAIEKMEDSFKILKSGFNESVYSTKFVVKRDLEILKQYKQLLKNK